MFYCDVPIAMLFASCTAAVRAFAKASFCGFVGLVLFYQHF